MVKIGNHDIMNNKISPVKNSSELIKKKSWWNRLMEWLGKANKNVCRH
jgi:hypothetical protein